MDMSGTRDVLRMLRAEGFAVTDGLLRYLRKDWDAFPEPMNLPGGAWGWLPEHVDALRAELRRRRRGPGQTPRRRSRLGGNPLALGGSSRV